MILRKPADAPPTYTRAPLSVTHDVTYSCPALKNLEIKVTFSLNPHEVYPRGVERPLRGVLEYPAAAEAKPDYGQQGAGPLIWAGFRHPHADLQEPSTERRGR